jgi:hypothetical protein
MRHKVSGNFGGCFFRNHFLVFRLSFWIGEPFADHEKETRADLCEHQEKSEKIISRTRIYFID